MRIMARTTYTKELLQRFIWFSMFRSRLQIMIFITVETVGFISLGLCIFLTWLTGNRDFYIYIMMTVTLFIFYPLLLLLMLKMALFNSKSMIGVVNTYLFTDSEVIVESTMPAASGQTRAGYAFFYRGYETKEAFYLFITKQQAFILSKADIVGGSPNDLRHLLRRNLPADKFVSKFL